MANVHRVLIKGRIPFDIVWEHPEVQYFFAIMNSPTIGIKIKYGKTFKRPNEHGGRTTYYEFEISGEEAIRGSNLESYVEELKKGGAELDVVEIEDIEA